VIRPVKFIKDRLYRDLAGFIEGGGPMKPEMIIPDDYRDTVRGQPIEEQNHTLSIKKNDA
jgi:hypothetical protein